MHGSLLGRLLDTFAYIMLLIGIYSGFPSGSLLK